MTVRISIKDKATLNSSSDRSRASTRDFGFNIDHEVSFAGWSLMQNSPASGSSDVDSASTHKGEGETKREETIDFVLAAVVTDVLPNGNLIVRGSQEVRVNYEVRILQVAGIVRPRDIEQDNSISYDKIAEARISYGGRGRISEVQQPGIGQQLLDIITPF